MRGLLTTQEQGGWRELIHKEAYCRINWKAKYGHKYPRRMPDYGISKRKCFLPAICLPEEEKSSIQHQEGVVPKVQQLPAEKDGPSRQEPLPEMRAPTPRTAQLLYHGVSHEGNGRHLYLKERKTKGPEEKFCYPLVSSWEYGWRLGKHYLGLVVMTLIPQHVGLPDELGLSCF